MMYMTSETTNPAKIMSSQTEMEKGARKANRFTDLAGAFTYSRLMPRTNSNDKILKEPSANFIRIG